MTYNCSCLGGDIGKIFDVYWLLAQKDSKIPNPWPKKYETTINAGVQTDKACESEQILLYISHI